MNIAVTRLAYFYSNCTYSVIFTQLELCVVVQGQVALQGLIRKYGYLGWAFTYWCSYYDSCVILYILISSQTTVNWKIFVIFTMYRKCFWEFLLPWTLTLPMNLPQVTVNLSIGNFRKNNFFLCEIFLLSFSASQSQETLSVYLHK